MITKTEALLKLIIDMDHKKKLGAHCQGNSNRRWSNGNGKRYSGIVHHQSHMPFSGFKR